MGFLTQNLGWKAVSLVAAALLWVVVSNEPELATFQTVPVEYKQFPDDLEIGSTIVESVLLEMRGPSGRLRDLRDAKLAVVLDFSGDRRAGEQTFTVRDRDITLPPGIHLVRAIPAQIRFRLERRVARQVPVEVRFSNSPPPGYTLAECHVQPETLTIEGPESRVSSIRSVTTDPIDIASVVGASRFQVHTFTAEPQVRIQTSSLVAVQIVVKKK
jgi:YbbR domain-containing protein